MGIYDRDYVRRDRDRERGRVSIGTMGPSFGKRSLNTWLIIANVAVFLVGVFVPGLYAWLFEWGYFSTSRGFFGLEVWRLVTFQFLHAHFWHLFFNMFGLFIFGGQVESYLGSKRYAAFYLACGVFGGLTYLALNLLGQTGLQMPGLLFNDPDIPLVGASAGVFGVIMACAAIAPTQVLQLIFPPIPLKMRTFAYIWVGISLLNLLTGGTNAGGDAAHVGGAVAGAFLIRNAHLLRDFFDVFNDSRKGTPRPKRRVGGMAGGDPDEIDRILDKVQRDGLGSLSEREKRELRKASERQGR